MKKKDSTSTQVPVDKMECKTIDPETFTFNLPASTSTRSANRSTTTAKSKLLALSVYILNTTDDFKDLTYRITRNTASEENLVITHGRNLGLLGENLDPVTLTLTEKGVCSLNVLFRPAEKFHLLEKTLFDAGEFVSILKRLTTKDAYLFCPGIKDIQPACFVKKLTFHTHPFARQQSIDCTVWYKNTEDVKDKLVVQCKPCRDLFKHLQTLPKKATNATSTGSQENENEKQKDETPRRSKRGRKRKGSTGASTEDQGESNKNNNNVETVIPSDKQLAKSDNKSVVESPSAEAIVKPQSPRSSRRISEKGVSFCKHCVCFHNEKDGKCPAITVLQSDIGGEEEEEVSDTEMTSEDLTKPKSGRGRRNFKTPTKRKSTEENVPVVNEEALQCDLVIEEVNVNEMDVGAHEELEYVVKQESEEEEEEVIEEVQPDSKKRRKSSRNKFKKAKPDEANESLDELDAGASALLALNRGRKRPESSSQTTKKPGRPRVLGNQHSAPSGIEALLTAAMTADKDDKGGNKSGKKIDNHLPTPRNKRDQLNTPFKLLMAQIESDKRTDNDSTGDTWKCPECGDHYSSKTSLRKHLRIHDLYRPYFCPVCDKTFVQKITLKVHMRLHSGDKPHTCSICNRSFAQKSNMETHLRRHLGQRPYKCHLCNKGFSDKGSLGEHAKTHTGEQPYVCPICNKAFSQRANMRTHMRRHKDDRPYACSKCNKMFKNKDGYWKHITAVHKDTTLKSDIPNLQTMEYYYKKALDKDSSDDNSQEIKKEEVEIEEIAEEDHDEVLMLIGEDEVESTGKGDESVVVIENNVSRECEAAETVTETGAASIVETVTATVGEIPEVSSVETKEVTPQTVTITESVKTSESEASTTAETEAATSAISVDEIVETEPSKSVSIGTKLEKTPPQATDTCYSALLNSLKSKVTQQIKVKENAHVTQSQLQSGTPVAFIRNGNQISLVSPVISNAKPALVVGKVSEKSPQPAVSLISNIKVSGSATTVNPTLNSIKTEPDIQPTPVFLKSGVHVSSNSTPSPMLISRVIPASVNTSTIFKTAPVINKVSPVIQTERVTVCKSKPPEGYIAVSLVGSDGRPMGSRYMNPKDLGLTVSIEKSNVTKCQLSSILADNKNIVTSTVVTDPYSGKTVTFKPKAGSSSTISQGISTVISPVTSSHSPLKIAPKTVIAPQISSPLQKTILLASSDKSPGQKTVILDMSSKVLLEKNTSSSVVPISIPVTTFSQNKAQSKASVVRSPSILRSPVKTNLKSLVNASTLKSVAEKCKASVAQSPMVKTLLRSPPLSHAEISHLEELKGLKSDPAENPTPVEFKIKIDSHDQNTTQTSCELVISQSSVSVDTRPNVSSKTVYVIKNENLVNKATTVITEGTTTATTSTTQNTQISQTGGDKSETSESIEVMVDGHMETVTIPLT